MKRLLLGVDESGRGPLAGPVAIGVVAVPPIFDFNLIEGVRDSKQMTELGREIWFEKLRVLAEERVLRYTVVFSSARMIDTRGIAPAVRTAIARALRELEVSPEEADILLDGALRAPRRYMYQKTIIGGDESEPLIALASIAAKVKRDRLMRRLALRYPEYGFDIHKGYGTKKHREALIKHGLCDIHRRTFCRVDEVVKKA
jgi:ribonuclease HII